MGNSTFTFEPVVDALGTLFRVSGCPTAKQAKGQPRFHLMGDLYESVLSLDDGASTIYVARIQDLGRRIRTGLITQAEAGHELDCLSRELRELQQSASRVQVTGEFYTPRELIRRLVDVHDDSCESVDSAAEPDCGPFIPVP